MIRLNRFIASATEYSRRQADSFIKRGDITVNGKIITDLSTKVSLKDKIALHGKILTPLKKVYYILNKPRGFVCTNNTNQSIHIVTDLVPANPPVFSVGRLDKDTTGLLILTNDGELAQRLTHPRFQKEKEYLVYLNQDLKINEIESLLMGIKIDGKIMKFDKLVKKSAKKYLVILHQGFNRQIRIMFNYFGYKVLFLQRIRIGNFVLRDLPVGKYIKLSPADIRKYFIKK